MRSDTEGVDGAPLRYELTVFTNQLGDTELVTKKFNTLREIVDDYKRSSYSAFDCEIWDNEENRKVDAWTALCIY